MCGTDDRAFHLIEQPQIPADHADRPDPAPTPFVPRSDAWRATHPDAQGSASEGAGVDGDPQPSVFIAEIAFDADFEFYQLYGSSVSAVEQRVIETLHLVNLQYESEVQIRHDLTAIVVRTAEPDPYSSTNSSQLLAQFRSEWQNNQTDIPHDVAMLFTGKEIDGSIIGQASTLGGICTPLKYCHGQIECCGSTACATDLIAHELGHLWDGAHCQCSSPAYTMNPFITCANTFQPLVTRPSIEAHRDSRICLDIEISPDVPINDICALAEPIQVGTTPFTTINAFNDGPPIIAACAGGVERDVWFLFVGTELGYLTVDACGSEFDTKIAVYRDNCPSGTIAHRCNDNAGCPQDPLAASVTFPVGPGFAFYIEVGSPDGSTGNGVLNLTFEPVATPCQGDANADGMIDSEDLSIVLGEFGQSGAGLQGDLDGNAQVNSEDLAILLGAFGQSCG
ncbi:MAG: M12 family metallo-peptidase [Phycisphaerales bacterium]